jgi:hypothetical protein
MTICTPSAGRRKFPDQGDATAAGVSANSKQGGLAWRYEYFPSLSVVEHRRQNWLARHPNANGADMLSPRFLRMYAEKCRCSAQSMHDPKSMAEFEAMARDLEDWANDPAASSPSEATPSVVTYRKRAAAG